MALLTEFPAGSEPAPVVLVFCADTYLHRDDDGAADVARWLTRLGLHAVVVRHRTGPRCWPGAFHDARDALAQVRAGECGLAVDRRAVAVAGFGVGGHLAALLATDSPDVTGAEAWRFAGRPDAAMLGAPLIELRESFSGRIANPDTGHADDLLGDDADPELVAQLSAGTRVTAPEEEPMPDLFVWTTSDDPDLHPLHTVALTTSLAVAGVPFESHVLRSGDDTPAWADGEWRELAEGWLAGLGWLDAGS